MRFMISFNDGDMNFPQEDFAAVGRAAHDVMHEAMAVGAWIVGGGFMGFHPEVVKEDGTVTQGPLAVSAVHIGGFTILEVESKEEAHAWAAKIAKACRCPQEVREMMEDQEQEELQAHS